jgi:plastocyanin
LVVLNMKATVALVALILLSAAARPAPGSPPSRPEGPLWRDLAVARPDTDRAEAGRLPVPVIIAPAAQPSTRQVAIVAERYDFSPSRITVPVGTVLEMEVTSEDTLHGFRIQGTEVNVSVPKRGRGSVAVTFRADKAGRYTFECSRMCGAGHNFMRGEIRVVEAGAR